MGRPAKISGILLLTLAAAGAATGWWARGRLEASLPVLDGRVHLRGLSAPVTVTRDELGIPTITAASRADVARALGFLHAQDRFFQMDLARRRAAGELSALVGERAYEADRGIRLHRFREEARRALDTAEPAWRSILDAYAQGVNDGLGQLAAAPFEYLVLRQAPQPWRSEDSLLVVLSMFITLQDPDGGYEATLATMHDVLPEPMADFMSPMGTEWDSPIVGAPFQVPAIPGADVYDLRARRVGKPVPSPLPAAPTGRLELEATRREEQAALGSNNWAVSGQHTADGRALLANDMHLTVRVPNTWYRAHLHWTDASSSESRDLIGVTLPGTPALVVGSNTHVAWGFTNSQGDWSDIVLLEVDPSDASRYRTPDGWRQFDRFDETIDIAGQPARQETVLWTIWGPVMEADFRGRQRAYRWVAHDARRLGASVLPLESARSVEEAVDSVAALGAPGQNFVVADASGRIGWTIFGSIPRRVGFDGRLPVSWADGHNGWNGWLDPSEYPRVLDPPGGRIWTANARVVDGKMLEKIGDGNYEIGSRARIISERLAARDRLTARDFLDIQLDTSAEFLSRWRDLLVATLKTGGTPDESHRELRDLVDRTWDGHASPDSAGYRLVRMFREEASNAVMAFVLVECQEADPGFDFRTLRRREGPIWKILSERPFHLLDPRYASWDAFLSGIVDTVIERASREGGLGQPWSEWNVTVYRHPLSPGLPFIGRLLDMPQQVLPGDLYTPNMHWRSNASSERMIVSPGREAEGMMHMPTGQSGHPLSPFYANSHPAWVAGAPTPLLPGPTAHTLTLAP